MPQKIREIALATMGNPSVIVPGAQIAPARHPDTEFLLYGDSR
jgi:glycerol-3-phosphate acyltransferase PlsX